MKKMVLMVIFGLVIWAISAINASGAVRTIKVSANYPTIQKAINAAAIGDTVIVSAGTYRENVKFIGKDIILKSTNPADSKVVSATIIDGRTSGSVVTFSGQETSACVLSGFTIKNGKADYGGGINCANSSPTIQHCIITENTGAAGAGIFDGSSTITDCIISNNAPGSGIYYLWDSGGIIRNCVITGNSYYGIHTCLSTTLTIINCTISNNYGSGIDCYNSTSLTIINSILWGDSYNHKEIYFAYFSGNSTLTIINSDIENGKASISITGSADGTFVLNWGKGNITSDPKFVDSEKGDFHLQPNSSCIDAGCPITGLTDDIEGNHRPLYSGFDMGAYESVRKNAVNFGAWILYE